MRVASIEASLLSVAEARLEEKDLVERLLQLYLYDMAGFTGDRVDADSGRYPYDYFEQYWTDEDRTPYLFRLDGQPAGFCFVNRWTLVYDPPDSALSIAEFFVMREARRGGLGREGALRIIRARPGDWEIRVNRLRRVRCGGPGAVLPDLSCALPVLVWRPAIQTLAADQRGPDVAVTHEVAALDGGIDRPKGDTALLGGVRHLHGRVGERIAFYVVVVARQHATAGDADTVEEIHEGLAKRSIGDLRREKTARQERVVGEYETEHLRPADVLSAGCVASLYISELVVIQTREVNDITMKLGIGSHCPTSVV